MNGERVGTWTTAQGRRDTFAYVESWLKSGGARPLSLSLPLRSAPHTGEVVGAYFENLLPESRQIRERLQHRFETDSTRAFDLLLAIGRDCVGAVQLSPVDSPPPDLRRIDGQKLTARQIERLLGDLVAPRSVWGDDDVFRISLAGAQEKTALLFHRKNWMSPHSATPTTHILKLPIGIANRGVDLTTSLENEWLCAEILRAYDVPVAPCRIRQFGAQRVLVVERFDRRLSSDGTWIMRLPQEDFCQATGTPPDRKYESEGGPGIRRIMDLLLGSSEPERDRNDFFRTQMLFWMLCAIDGHAKNFSIFLEPGGGYRLTPRYDVLSAFPVLGRKAGLLPRQKVTMAMAVDGTTRHYRWANIQPRHWQETARRCGMGAFYPRLRDELVERTPMVIDTVRGRIPKGFPEFVSEPILKGLQESVARLQAAA
jgi:serine/threonine-protein kinase HipA